MQVAKKMFPLKHSVEKVQGIMNEMARTGSVPLFTFT
jgi:hypothetical protein